MSEIAMLAGIAAIGSAATYTAWPFLTGRVDEREYLEAGPEEEIAGHLFYLEDRAHSALAQLDEDKDRTRTSVQAYQSEKKRLQKALRLIDRHLDALEDGRLPSYAAIAELEDGILGKGEDLTEAVLEVEEAPAELEPPPAARTKVKPSPRRRSTSTVLMCPVCGHAEEEGDAAFCGRCGSALSCRSCGQAIRDPEAAFCGRCGGSLARGGEGTNR